MRWTYFILLQIVIIVLFSSIVYQHKNKVTLLKTPPADLAQWYKPENKRQVWLHNMFKLRREMQAVEFYAETKNDVLLQQWSEKLNQHYLKIADMVPKWQSKLDVTAMAALTEASVDHNYESVLRHLGELEQSCDSCHNDYQAMTALIYRTPDFSGINVTKELSLKQHMNILTKQLNQVKISSQDGYPELALVSLDKLSAGMSDLGAVCHNCHKNNDKSYPSNDMNETIDSLKLAISSGSIKEQGKHIGTLAVLACASCHGTHRLSYGAKDKLSSEDSFVDLIKHK